MGVFGGSVTAYKPYIAVIRKPFGKILLTAGTQQINRDPPLQIYDYRSIVDTLQESPDVHPYLTDIGTLGHDKPVNITQYR